MQWTASEDRQERMKQLVGEEIELEEEPEEAFWKLFSLEQDVVFTELEITRHLLSYLPPLLLVVATIGNIMSTVVLWRLFRKVLSTCLYVFCSMMVDLLVLYVHCGNDWLSHLANVDVKHVAQLSSRSMCKIYPFLADLVMHLSVWLTVAMAIETSIVCLRPQRLMRVCVMERARAVIMLMLVLLVCINTHCFWSFALVKVEKTSYQRDVCTTSRQGNLHSDYFRRIIWPVLDVLIADLAPYLILFSCSVIMLTRRIRRREQMKQLESTWKAYSVDANSAKECHLAILVICLLHLVFLLPKLGYDVFVFLVHPATLELVSYSPFLDAKLILAEAACFSSLYVYLSCKFLVFIVVSKRFRSEFKLVIMCHICRQPQSQSDGPVTQQPLLNRVNNVNRPVTNCISRMEYSMTSV